MKSGRRHVRYGLIYHASLVGQSAPALKVPKILGGWDIWSDMGHPVFYGMMGWWDVPWIKDPTGGESWGSEQPVLVLQDVWDTSLHNPWCLGVAWEMVIFLWISKGWAGSHPNSQLQRRTNMLLPGKSCPVTVQSPFLPCFPPLTQKICRIEGCITIVCWLESPYFVLFFHHVVRSHHFSIYKWTYYTLPLKSSYLLVQSQFFSIDKHLNKHPIFSQNP